MLDQVLRRMRLCVRSGQYVVTVHAEEELDEDELTVFDLEEIILTGTIAEMQKDRKTGELKYLVHGQALAGEPAVVVSKLGPTGKMVVITVYRS